MQKQRNTEWKMGKLIICLILIVTIGILTGCSNSDKVKSNSTVETEKETEEKSENRRESMAKVWRIARRGIYKDGKWSKEGYEYPRNEYGLYTAIKVLDETGEQIGNNAKIKEDYDENGRLVSFDNGHRIFFFIYDEDGKITEINVRNSADVMEMFTKLQFSDKEGTKYCVTEYDTNYDQTYEQYYYDENMNNVYREIIDKGNLIYKNSSVYSENGFLTEENYTKKGVEYHKDYSYDADGNLLKESEYINEVLFSTDDYTYSSKGNLLKHVGVKYGSLLVTGAVGATWPNGKEYVNEVYTDEDYDEQGRCAFWYDDGEKVYIKTAWKYEYAKEGWLLSESYEDGRNYKQFDKDGNVLIESMSGSSEVHYEYKEYEVIDDELLLAFYELCGEDYM